MLQIHPKKALRISSIFALAGAFLLPLPDSPAASAPSFKNLRGNYKGSAEIVIQRKNRRTISGPVKIRVRLSRNKRKLEVKISGNLLSNNRTGSLSSVYRFSAGGNTSMRMNESITPGALTGSGTSNIRKKGGRFTLRASAYGMKGISSGSLKLRGRTLLLTQNFTSGGSKVSVKYIAPKTGRR